MNVKKKKRVQARREGEEKTPRVTPDGLPGPM